MNKPPFEVHLASNGNYLFWDHESGVGRLKSNGFDYDDDYFNYYVDLNGTKIADELNEKRCEFVKKHLGETFRRSDLCDVGVGSGIFTQWIGGCKGTDVNPVAIKWLTQNNLYHNLELEDIEHATFWDSLEHIDDFSGILDNVRNMVFISCPIYTDFDDVIRSKHFKPNEHIWYWTEKGLVQTMRDLGFEMVDTSRFEEECGREGIGSYAFKRVKR